MGLRSLIEKRAFTSSTSAAWEKDFPSLAGMLKTFSGKKVNQRSALSMVAVYACQSLIADGISSLPLDHLQNGANDTRIKMTKAAPWVATPNPYQTPIDFWHRVIQSLLSDGNAFIATIRNSSGVVVALYCLEPTGVEIIEGTVIADNKYRIAGTDFDRSQVLHVPAFALAGTARGLSPIDVAREAIGLGLTAEEYGARFFAQGASLSGIIEHPGKPGDGEAKMLKEMFRKTHAGTKNSHAVGVLTGGAAFKPITVTPEQAQFLETRRFQKGEIALLYRIPAYMVDPTITSTWGTGIEEQNAWFVQQTLMPWIVRIEQAIATFLLPPGQFVKFNVNARLRPNTKDRYEAYAIAVNNGWMNLDDVRALEDLPPIEKGLGKKHYRPTNHESIDTKPKPDNATAPAPAPDPAPKVQPEKVKTND